MKDRYPTIRLCSILSLVLLCGCTTAYIVPSSNTLIKNRCYTYAVYNDQGRLLTHPLLDFENNMAFTQSQNDPYTDIYIVSHGWNYDLQESITSYQKYMDQINELMKKTSGDSLSCEHRPSKIEPLTENEQKKIKPFFIFVSWPSATRPLTSLLSSVLPFGLDDALKPVSLVLDNIVFFLPTAWKQSINASKIALGVRYPNEYLFERWTNQYYGSGSLRESMGRDIPLSSLVYQLLEKVFPHEHPSATSPTKPRLKIHMVGHSYGAKISILSALEGLRHWKMREQYSDLLKNYHDNFKVCFSDESEQKRHNIESAQKEIRKCSRIQQREEQENIRKQIIEERERKSLKELNTQNSSGAKQPHIESLILFNPAFHPAELAYLYDSFPILNSQEEDSLSHIESDKEQPKKNKDCQPQNTEECNPKQIKSRNQQKPMDLYAKFLNRFLHEPSGPCRLLDLSTLDISCETEVLLEQIKRKAIVFSDTDRANGPFFSISQLVLNNAISQNASRYTSDMTNASTMLPSKITSSNSSLEHEEGIGTLMAFPRILLDGAQTLATSVTSSAFTWAFQTGTVALGYSGLDSSSFWHRIFFGSLLSKELGKGKDVPIALNTHQPTESLCVLSFRKLHPALPTPFRISSRKFYSFNASEIFTQPLMKSYDPLIGSHNDLRSTELTTCNSKHLQERQLWQELVKQINILDVPQRPSTQELVALLGVSKTNNNAKNIFPDTQITRDQRRYDRNNSIQSTTSSDNSSHDDSMGITTGSPPFHPSPMAPNLSLPNVDVFPENSSPHGKMTIHFPGQDFPIYFEQESLTAVQRIFDPKGKGNRHLIMKESGYEFFTIEKNVTRPDYAKQATIALPNSKALLKDPLELLTATTIQQCQDLFQEDDESYELSIEGTAREVMMKCITHQILGEQPWGGESEEKRSLFNDVQLDAIVASTAYIRASNEPYEVSPDWNTQLLLPSRTPDFIEFMERLLNPTDDPSQYLQSHLTPQTRQLLGEIRTHLSPQTLKTMRKNLTKYIQTLIDEHTLYEEKEFSKVLMSETTQKMWNDITEVGVNWRSDGHDIGGKDRMLLNQYLIVDAFPNFLTNEVFTYYGYWKHQGLPRYGKDLLTLLSGLLSREITRICVLPKTTKLKKRDHTLNFVLNFSQFQCAEGQDCHSPLSNAFEAIDESELACYTEPSPASSSKVASVFTSAPSQEKYP